MNRSKRNYGSIDFWINNAIFGISIFLSWYISTALSTNGIIQKENAQAILNALLNVNIALIAFFGLILVFHLNYVTNIKERVAREKHETTIERDRFSLEYLTKIDSVGSSTLPSLQKAFSEIDTKYKERVLELDEQFRSLVVQISGVAIAAVFTIGFLFGDILLNVFFMGETTSEGLPFMDLFWTLLMLLLALYLILSSLIFVRPKHEREILTQEMKKKWEEVVREFKNDWHKKQRKE